MGTTFPARKRSFPVRLNGYLAGYGTEANFQSELDKLGLSPAGRDLLQEKVAGRLEGFSGPGCPVPGR